MDIHGTTVMVLGGGGMVGRAVCRELLDHAPARIVVASYAEAETRAAIELLQEELERKRSFQPGLPSIELVPEWGNMFVREDFRHRSFPDIMSSPEGRAALIEDTFVPLQADTLERYGLYRMILRHHPDILVDAVNTATGIAYMDVFKQARSVWAQLSSSPDPPSRESVEQLMCSMYIPQLIRHVEILYRSMVKVDTKAYVKVGTSGTGGMGWNIPYTHGEERPSLLLLSKSAVAGAQTLLLFLLARTPAVPTFGPEDAEEIHGKRPPATKEIKPTAMIGWREIGYGDIRRKGQPIELEDVRLDDSVELGADKKLLLDDPSRGVGSGKRLRTVYVDTGENGMFSAEEFVAITSPGQMGFVTPEEIARNVVDEILGINTGKDVINALNVTSMGPTYRAGFQRERAIGKLRDLQRQHATESVAFEILGPPRLSKLLFEAHLLRRHCKTLDRVAGADPAELTRACLDILRSDPELLATPVTLGIPILLEDQGRLRLVRGRTVKTPPSQGQNELEMGPRRIEEWAGAGWIDLRTSNMERWKKRIQSILAELGSIPHHDTSSRYLRDRDFWLGRAEGEINPGELVAWIFNTEDRGERGRE
ncbi:MAG: short-chain dehydrogenase [Candidatus Eremiobacterota bacterium]